LGTVVLPYGLTSSFRFLKSKMDGCLYMVKQDDMPSAVAQLAQKV
jgi:hypothetical protein